MYIPPENHMPGRGRAIAFMQRYSFATLVSAEGGVPVATHLPFVVREEGEKLVLLSHLARQNAQARLLEGRPALVVFQEPHAYISPSHYEKQLNVPTWNYLAVHAYGTPALIPDPQAVLQLLETTIHTYEAGYQAQWQRLPDQYKHGLVRDLVAFRIEVTDLQAKEKLSQDKARTEQRRIVDALSQSDVSAERAVAGYMQQNLESDAS